MSHLPQEPALHRLALTAYRAAMFLYGVAALALVAIGISGSAAFLAPDVAHATNGQCVWEGGPGAPTYAECDQEDCPGAGGHAQCGQPVLAPAPGYNDQDVDSNDWVYTTGITDQLQGPDWCMAEGGTYDGTTETCAGMSAGYIGNGLANSESLVLSAALAALNFWYNTCSVSVQSVSGWGQAAPPGIPAYQNGQLTADLEQVTYLITCRTSTSTTLLNFTRLRQMQCPSETTRRTLPNGDYQCVIPVPACCRVGDPYDPVTGAEVQHFVDYRAGGVGGIEFGRYYSSQGPFRYPGDTQVLTLPSDYWRFSYQRHLIPITGNSGLSAIIQREDGTLEDFDAAGNEILNQSGAADRLQADGSSGWTLTRGNGDKEIYDSGGNLTSITRLNGLVISLTYSNGAISTISDSFGHTLTLAYSSGALSAVTLPDGSSTIQYTYGGPAGQLTNVTFADGTSVQYQYLDLNNCWRLTGIVDESAQQYATYTYGTDGTLSSEQHGNGVQAYHYNLMPNGAGNASVASITDPLNQNRTLSYTDASGVYKEQGDSAYCTDCANIQQETYDQNGNPQSVTDLDGNESLYSYDETRNLETSRTEGLRSGEATSATRTITTQWDPSLRQPDLISVYTGPTASGTPLTTTSYTYDNYGNVLTKTITDGTTGTSRTWTYTYFNGGLYGQVQSLDGPRTDVADVTSYTYYNCDSGGDCGQIHTVTDALGHTTTYDSYDANGMPLQITDPNGTVTTLTYDKRQRLTTEIVGSEETQYAYFPTGLLRRVTRPDGSYLSYQYDAAHRLTEVDDSSGDRLVYTLNAAGDREATQIYDSTGNLARASSAVYNSLDQLWQMLTSAATTSTETVYGYDPEGNQVSVNAPLQRTIANTYDSLNRLKTVTDPAGGLASYAYDPNDHLTSVTDPRGLATQYSYNGFGDLTQAQSPDSGTSIFTFDSGGNVATSTDGRNTQDSYSYDALDRIKQIIYPDQSVSFTYDQGTNGIGHLSTISDGTGQTGFTYDALGRVTGKTEVIAGQSLNIAYSYQNSDLISLTTPSGQVLIYGYNGNGQISSISLNGSALLSSVTYSPFGPVAGWTWGNGTAATRAYDLDGQTTDADGVTYTYNDDGTIGSRTDPVESDYSVVVGVTSVSVSSNSNRISSSSGSLVRTYSYDGAGNTLGNSNASLTYNGAGRLASATEGTTTATFAVNAMGERVSKASSDGTVLFAYDEQGHLIGEYGSTGALIEETVWLGDIPVATLRPDVNGGVDVYYVHTDQLNTPRWITRAGDGTVVWRWSSDPYGNGFVDEDPEGSGQSFVYNLRFPGQYYDAETGLVYNGMRDYDPEVGRYVESDPIGLNGGSYSTYAYARLNPLSFTDPTGLVPNPAEATCIDPLQPICWGGVIADIATWVAAGGAGAAAMVTPSSTDQSQSPAASEAHCPPAHGGKPPSDCEKEQQLLEQGKQALQNWKFTALTLPERVSQAAEYNEQVRELNLLIAFHNQKCPENQVTPLQAIPFSGKPD